MLPLSTLVGRVISALPVDTDSQSRVARSNLVSAHCRVDLSSAQSLSPLYSVPVTRVFIRSSPLQTEASPLYCERCADIILEIQAQPFPLETSWYSYGIYQVGKALGMRSWTVLLLS